MKHKFAFFLVIFLFFSKNYSQNYKPLDTADYAERKLFLKSFEENNEILIKSLKQKYDSETGSELSKFYKEFQKSFEKEVKNKDFTFTSPFDKKIAKIISELKKSNPQIPNNLKVLVARDNTPNAFCLADGTFIVNMGLFNWLENEGQIASVLSHELGHKILEHTLKSLLKGVDEKKLDKSAVENIREINVNKSQKAFDIVNNRFYKKGIEKRKNEISADSIGYVLYRNSGYQKSEYINALKNLNEFDTISPRELKITTYKKIFEIPKQPFKDKWLKKEDFSLYNYNFYKEKLDKDSLSTHPELVKRMNVLSNYFVELKNQEKPKEADEDFKNLQIIAQKEILPNFYHDEEYGAGIYVALQFLQDNEDEEYYKAWLGKCFEKIYTARKNYNLNRYLDRVDPKNQSESYQQFLNFMWNLSMDEIKNISDFYNNKGT